MSHEHSSVGQADAALFKRAVVFGIAAALAAAIIDTLFIASTAITTGYLALLVAWMIGKAMTFGSRGHGGRRYQVTAVVLTYLALAAAQDLVWWWFARQKGKIPLDLQTLSWLMRLGLTYPFMKARNTAVFGVIGFIIMLFSLRTAWRMTSGKPDVMRHPFRF
jgi:hypothetical protein